MAPIEGTGGVGRLTVGELGKISEIGFERC
jgi:hypothetical protein